MTTVIVIASILGYLAVGWWLAPIMAGKTCARAIEKERRDYRRRGGFLGETEDEYAYHWSEIDREVDGPAVYGLTIPLWPIIATYNTVVAHGFGYRDRMMTHDPALRAETIKRQQQRIAQLERELGIGGGR